MNAPVRRQTSLLPELSDWFESFPSLLPWRAMTELHAMRLEDYIEDGRYVLRVELPGIDPEKDVEITVGDGLLTVRAERSEEKAQKGRSEFRYGSFQRTVRLPDEAKEDSIAAAYKDGILTITVDLGEKKEPVRRIAVERGS